MPRTSRYHILVIFSLFVGIYYITYTLLGVASKSMYIGTRRDKNESVYKSVENNSSKDFMTNMSVGKYSLSCSEIQDEARLRIENYCKTKTKNWTEVKYLLCS